METKNEFVKEVKEILVKFFNKDYNYQIEELAENQLWIKDGPMGYSLGFYIQENWIGVYLEKEIPEVPAIIISGTGYESTLSSLKSNLNLLLRRVDKVLKFYHDGVVELLGMYEDFEPCDLKMRVLPDGNLAVNKYDSTLCKRGGAYQDIRVTWNPETDDVTVSSYRSYKRYVGNDIEGYNTLYIARSKGLSASYKVEEDNTSGYCLLIRKSKEDFKGFPGWKSIMDPSKDLELFRSI